MLSLLNHAVSRSIKGFLAGILIIVIVGIAGRSCARSSFGKVNVSIVMATLGVVGIGCGRIQLRKGSSGVRLRRSVDGRAGWIVIFVVSLFVGNVVARLSATRLLTITSDGVALDIA